MELKEIMHRSSKGQLMTLIILVIFILMLSELFVFALLNVDSNNIAQSLSISTASSNYAGLLQLSANNFAKESLNKAVRTLYNYESTPSLRKGNFITNTSLYLTYLVVNGTLPNDTSAGYPYNAMGNLTLKNYNKSVSTLLGFASQVVAVNETRPNIFQTDPYHLRLSFIQRVAFNTSGSNYVYSIPVNVSMPLNNTPDLFYAQQGILKPITFASLTNITSVVGSAGATSGNTLQYAYGTIYTLPSSASSSVTCPLAVNTLFNSAPLNYSIIIATYNAISLGACANNYAGLITYKAPSSPPANVPYLVYPSAGNILASLPNGTRVLEYGPGLETLNIEGLRSAIINGYYFASPFTPSYLDRAQGNFRKQSQNGIFTFSNYNTQTATFNAVTSYIIGSNSLISTTAGTNNTVSFWMYWKGTTGQMPFTFSSGTNYDLYFQSGTCFGFNSGNGDVYGTAMPNLANKWVLVTAVFYNGGYTGNSLLYINGTNQPLTQCLGSKNGVSAVKNFEISGILASSAYYFGGSIANVQIYNKSLAPSQIMQMYQEGISGVPPSNSGLVVWYPLQGSTNDYSGDGANGIAANVIYTIIPNYIRDSAFVSQVPTRLSPIPGVLSCTNNMLCASTSNSMLYLGYMPLLSGSGSLQTASFGTSSACSNLGYTPIRMSSLGPSIPTTLSAITISWWVNPVNPSVVLHLNSGNAAPGGSGIYCGSYYCDVPNVAMYSSKKAPGSTWSFFTLTLGSTGAANVYINGNANVPVTWGGPLTSISDLNFLGYEPSCADWTYGSLSNVQMYSSPLSAAQVQQLYQEGIAGMPLSGNLIGWWPLSTDPNDYSGYNSNGVATNVVYPYFAGAYNSPGLSTIATSTNEWQALGLSNT